MVTLKDIIIPFIEYYKSFIELEYNFANFYEREANKYICVSLQRYCNSKDISEENKKLILKEFESYRYKFKQIINLPCFQTKPEFTVWFKDKDCKFNYEDRLLLLELVKNDLT